MTTWIETTPDVMQCFNCDFTGTMKELVEHQSVCPILTENVRILLQEEGENDEQQYTKTPTHSMVGCSK